MTASTFAAASSDAAVAASGATFIKNQLQIGVLVAFARANGKAICHRPQSNPLRQRGWKFCSGKPTETDRLGYNLSSDRDPPPSLLPKK